MKEGNNEKLTESVREWLNEIREEYKSIEELVEKKEYEILVLKAKTELAIQSVERIKSGVDRENFFKKFHNQNKEEIKKIENELEGIKEKRRQVKIYLEALEKGVEGSSFREAL